MISSKILAGLALAATAMATSAQATVFTLDLSGAVASGSYGDFTQNGQHYNTYVLDLGLGGATPFIVSQGDEIQATVTLDGALPVPAGGEQFLGVNFNGVGQPDGVSNNGTFLFTNLTGLGSNPVSTNCGNCLSAIFSQTPGQTYSFTGLFADTTISTLNTPFVVNDVSISYQVSSAVPEPASWSLMLIGFGGLGAMTRAGRRRRGRDRLSAA